MRVPLLYGRGSVDALIPPEADVTVIRKPGMPLLKDAEQRVGEALQPVQIIAEGCKTACILVCDITRPVPNGLFLRPLIERLQSAGVALDQIMILIATGLHRRTQDGELEELIDDEWVLQNVSIADHVATEDGDHIDFGTTKSGTPVRLDRRFVEADFKIVTGLVEPHFMAGWSGGRKVLVPGIAHAETIRTVHSARFIEHPDARACNLDGNPLHIEQEEIVSLLCERTNSSVYAINTVIDEARQVAFVNFGEVLSSHAEAVNFAQRYCVVTVPNRFDTVVTSSAGFPLDLTYYQTVKGMVTPLQIVSDNANLIVASECSEGLGSESFRTSQQRLLEEGSNGFLSRIRSQTLAEIDEWETEEQLRATNRAHVQLFSEGLQGDDRELTGVEMIESLQDAITQSVNLSKDKRVAVIPEGPYVVPSLRQES